MTRLRKNVVANFAGQASATLIQLAITPIYLGTLGVEAYGLIGFQVTLQALMQVLDFGLSPTINRELARYSALPEKTAESRDFVRTLELGYWLIGAVLGLGLFAAAPYLGQHWLNRSSLPAAVVERSLHLSAVLIAVQWPLTFYQGGLLGLNQHGSLNRLRVAIAALTAAGGYVVVTRVSATVTALFTWLVAAAVAHVVSSTWLLWRHLPASPRPPRVRVSAVRHVGGFAAGMTVITLTTLLMTQLDRVVLSRLVSLEQFGYYVVAGLVSGALTAIARQTFVSVFPRFSALVATGDLPAIERTYRHAWQFIAALIVPAAAVVAVFPAGLLLLWTHSADVAGAAGPIASYLAVGTAINGLMAVPYALQIAHGWTSLSIRLNLALTLLAVPAIILGVQHRGALGASMVWPALMAIYMAVALPITHRALVPHIGMRWFLREVAVPVGAAASATLACRLLLPPTIATWPLVIELSIAWLTASIALVLPSPFLRRELGKGLARLEAYARGQSLEANTR